MEREGLEARRSLHHLQIRRDDLICISNKVGPLSEVLVLKHESRILGQWSYPVCGSRKSQASSPWAKQHTGLDVCPRILLSCFISKNSDHHQQQQPQLTSLMSYLIAPTSLVPFLGRWPLLATQSLTARGEEGPSWNWRTFCSIRKSPSVRNTT